jgi:hypothetical protein
MFYCQPWEIRRLTPENDVDDSQQQLEELAQQRRVVQEALEENLRFSAEVGSATKQYRAARQVNDNCNFVNQVVSWILNTWDFGDLFGSFPSFQMINLVS